MELGIQSLFYLLTESNLSEEGISWEIPEWEEIIIYLCFITYLFICFLHRYL